LSSSSIASTTSSVGAGHSFALSYQMNNNGQGDAQQPFTNQVYLSRDVSLDSGDLLVDSYTLSSNFAGGTIGPAGFSANQLSISRSNIQVPTGTPGGSYYMIVKLDALNQIDETGPSPAFNGVENDNVVVGSYPITVVGPDLQLTVPSTVITGTYRLFVKTDSGNAVDEGSETNNTAASSTFAIAVITVAPATLPTPTLDTPYSQTLTASDGTAPYTFAVTGGSLPNGLTLRTAGLI